MNARLPRSADTATARALLQQRLGSDPWVRGLVENTTDDALPAAGRVLRAKLGYNPNSSSVGSVITVLLWGATIGSAVMNVLAARVATPVPADGAVTAAGDDAAAADD